MSKRTTILILALVLVLVLVVIVSAAFVSSDFNVSTAETTGDIQTASYVKGEAGINLTGGFYVFVVSADGGDGLVKELNKTLIFMLDKHGVECVGGGIFQDEELKDRYDAQVIIVDLSDRKVSYMPFYSSANLTAFLFYSSNGNVSWRSKEDPVTFVMPEPEEGMWMRSKVSRVDRTRGIISLKAYEKHLAEEIAKAVINELDMYKNVEK
jgi:hypothetical protein